MSTRRGSDLGMHVARRFVDYTIGWLPRSLWHPFPSFANGSSFERRIQLGEKISKAGVDDIELGGEPDEGRQLSG